MSHPESGKSHHEDFSTRHAPMPIEIPVDDEEAGRAQRGGMSQTDVDLKTQLVRFVVTGAGSGVLDFGLTYLLQAAVGLDPWLAKTIGFIVGTTTAYLINRRWTFNADGSKRQFASVMLLYGITFVLQVGIFTVLFPWLLSVGLGTEFLPKMSWAQLIGFVIAQGIATAVNFVVQRSVIFKA